MSTIPFDTVARRAARLVSRRGSLRALSGAALIGGLGAPAATRASKTGKKARKVCQRQRGACLAAVAEVCDRTTDPQGCASDLNPCCDPLARCDAGASVAGFFPPIG